MKNDKYKIICIENKYSGLRLDKFLQSIFRNTNNVLIQKALRNKDILVNMRVAQNNYHLKVNDNICLTDFIIKIFNSKPKNEKEKKEISISNDELEKFRKYIIYEDNNIFAINKPKGLAVQSGTKIEKSVNDYLKYLKDNNGEIPKLLHRLDKDTSGILILAKNRESADLLSNYFKNKDQNIDKIYLALVIGKFSKDQGEINIPLLKKVENGVEKVYKDEKEGKDAITLYKVIGYSTKYNVSLVEVKLLTGRTHQIRVHMKEIGHPILGDGKYGSKKAFVDELSNDMHLHAYYIKIKNFFDKDLEIKAPLSQEFKKTLNKLGIKNEYN